MYAIVTNSESLEKMKRAAEGLTRDALVVGALAPEIVVYQYSCGQLETKYSSLNHPRQAIPEGTDIAGLLTAPLDNTKSINWAYDDGSLIASDDRTLLCNALGLNVSRTQILFNVVNGLPFSLVRRPPWDGMKSLNPGETLCLDSELTVCNSVETPSTDASISIEKSLNRAVRDHFAYLSSRSARVGSDLSGGLYSGVVSALAHQYFDSSVFYHYSSSSPGAQDDAYAQMLADYLGVRLQIVGNSRSVRSYFSTSLPEGIPSLGECITPWSGFGDYGGLLFAQAAREGCQTYLTGLGGDDLYSNYLSIGLSMLRRGKIGIGWRQLSSIRIAGNIGRLPLVKEAYRNESLSDELIRKANGSGRRSETFDMLGWAPGFKPSRFLSEQAKEDLVDSLIAEDNIPEYSEEKFRHVAVDSAFKQGELLRSMQKSLAPPDLDLSSPLLCDGAIRAFLDARIEDFSISDPLSKDLLRRTFSDVLPSWILSRDNKDEFSLEMIDEFVRSRVEVRDFLLGGILADWGFIDKSSLLECVSSNRFEPGIVGEFAHLVNIERWLRRCG